MPGTVETRDLDASLCAMFHSFFRSWGSELFVVSRVFFVVFICMQLIIYEVFGMSSCVLCVFACANVCVLQKVPYFVRVQCCVCVSVKERKDNVGFGCVKMCTSKEIMCCVWCATCGRVLVFWDASSRLLFVFRLFIV